MDIHLLRLLDYLCSNRFDGGESKGHDENDQAGKLFLSHPQAEKAVEHVQRALDRLKDAFQDVRKHATRDCSKIQGIRNQPFDDEDAVVRLGDSCRLLPRFVTHTDNSSPCCHSTIFDARF